MARRGPLARNPESIVLGLAQIRIGPYLTNIDDDTACLLAAASIGAMANTKFTGNVDWFKLESGFPLMEDLSIPIREGAQIECAFKEVNPFTMTLAIGKDPAGVVTTISGEVGLGGRVAPEYVRAESVYTYPNGIDTMTIVFPRAQPVTNIELDMQVEDTAAVPTILESKRADDSLGAAGDAVWNLKPLGTIIFDCYD
ncbi:MAG: hypothetical protein GY865_17335 [candidate division Zixibacteria bacterium]|nr:hypothetical protein [candidate division Zixibacteria bacterium]